jgi:23S rRNA (cytidine1920-2'-O)/16S rRNA (cytidine1409-2'-O)-methyltransferase
VARNKERVDKLLVERGLAPTRTKAQALVMAGQVFVGEKRIEKPGDQLAIDVALSRGGHKLEAALQHFAIDVAGRVALDVGASTGGFTDCLLQHGASRVYAVDVGTHQLHEKLRADPRVILREQFNARELSSDVVREPVQLIVIDVSFISLRLVLPSALAFLEPGGVLVALVKPQFEAGRAEVDRGGGFYILGGDTVGNLLEVILLAGPGVEAARFHVDTGAIGFDTDAAGAPYLLVNGHLAQLLSADQYRLARP